MCGVFGSLAPDEDGRPSRANTVRAGLELLAHRGPDGAALQEQAGICVGHTRLAILDLVTGDQPMWSADRRGLIVYNGEVYNHADLRRELAAAGHEFVTQSDTEVVLNAYLEWGDDCVRRLRGMFAFAAVDFARQRALLAVDRLGIKPMYWLRRGGEILFASELEPLYRTVGPFRLDRQAIDDYLAWQYIAAPRTVYQDVHALKPAHRLSIDLRSGAAVEEQYWQLEFSEDRSLSPADWQAHLDEELRDAVRLHLMSDVPFGAFLSGGIDSSLVTGYMSDLLDEPVKTFSIGFNEADYSELEHARAVAELTGCEHHEEIVDADSLALLPLLVRHYGQPFADASAIPTYHVARMASRHVKMVLSGDGGDESFAGYSSYPWILRQLQAPPPPSGMSDIRGGYRLARYYARRLRSWAGVAAPWQEAYRHHCHTAWHFPPAERRQLWRAGLRDIVRDDDPDRRRLMAQGDRPLISRLQALDLQAYLPFDILTKVDRAAMASSLEVRVPLLDHHVVEAAARMPTELKLREITGPPREYEGKVALRRLAAQRFPPSIVDRPKQGFGVPLGSWFAGGLRDEVRKRLLGSEVLPELLDAGVVRGWVERHAPDQDVSARLWNLLVLDEWLRTHDETL